MIKTKSIITSCYIAFVALHGTSCKHAQSSMYNKRKKDEPSPSSSADSSKRSSKGMTLLDKIKDCTTQKEKAKAEEEKAKAEEEKLIEFINQAEIVDLNKAYDVSESTPLITAVRAQNLRIVDALLNRRVNVNEKDEASRTALMYAAESSSQDIVARLLKEDIDIDLLDQYEKTAILIAIKYNPNTDITEQLLNHYEKKYERYLNNKTIVQLQDIWRSWLGESIQNGACEEVFHLLLERCSNFFQLEQVKKLDSYVDKDYSEEIVFPLLQAAAIRLNNINNWTKTYLKELIEKGVPVNFLDHDNVTALMRAIQRNAIDSANVLITEGADIFTARGVFTRNRICELNQTDLLDLTAFELALALRHLALHHLAIRSHIKIHKTKVFLDGFLNIVKDKISQKEKGKIIKKAEERLKERRITLSSSFMQEVKDAMGVKDAIEAL